MAAGAGAAEPSPPRACQRQPPSGGRGLGARLSPLPAFLTGRRAMAPWGGRGLPAAPHAPPRSRPPCPRERAANRPFASRQPPPANGSLGRARGTLPARPPARQRRSAAPALFASGSPGCQQARRGSSKRGASVSEARAAPEPKAGWRALESERPFPSSGLGGLPSSAGPSTEPRLLRSPTAAPRCVRPGLEQLPPAGSHALPSSKYSSRRGC